MEKRVIIATILSTLVILLWWWFMPSTKPPSTPPSKLPEQIQQLQQKPALDIQPFKSKDYSIEMNFGTVTFNTAGAKIKNYYIREGMKFTDLILQPVDNSFTAGSFSTFKEKNFDCTSITSNTITFSTLIDKIKLQKKYTLSETGLHLLELEFKNQSNKKVQFEYELLLGPGVGCEPKERKSEIQQTKVVAFNREPSTKRIRGRLNNLKPGKHNTEKTNWIALGNRYYFQALVLCGQFGYIENRKVGSESLFEVRLATNVALAEHQTARTSFYFLIGAKKYSKLKEFQLGLENLIDFGFFSPLGKLAYFSLRFFEKLTKNYGIAIILLTFAVQIILLPLSLKSFQAARAMRALQPKIKELQLKYKNDPKRLNAEIMYLYKSQKVNPLGGCLPMIFQIPVFIALFTVLSNVYELKNAPFILWIKDLSAPDLLFMLGQLPIRLLPLLMGFGMFIQQKISGTGVDPSQKTFTYLMPAIFTIMFWNFPSGLVLYWLTSSILSTITQWIITQQPTKTR